LRRGIRTHPHHTAKPVGVVLITWCAINSERIVLTGIGDVPCIFVELPEERMGGGTIWD
jgi:hypothetical protein